MPEGLKAALKKVGYVPLTQRMAHHMSATAASLIDLTADSDEEAQPVPLRESQSEPPPTLRHVKAERLPKELQQAPGQLGSNTGRVRLCITLADYAAWTALCPKRRSHVEEQQPNFGMQLMLHGLLQMTMTWVLHATSDQVYG